MWVFLEQQIMFKETSYIYDDIAVFKIIVEKAKTGQWRTHHTPGTKLVSY